MPERLARSSQPPSSENSRRSSSAVCDGSCTLSSESSGAVMKDIKSRAESGSAQSQSVSASGSFERIGHARGFLSQRANRREHALERRVEDLEGNLELAVVVVEQRAFVKPDRVGNHLQAHSVVAETAEQLERRRMNAFA